MTDTNVDQAFEAVEEANRVAPYRPGDATQRSTQLLASHDTTTFPAGEYTGFIEFGQLRLTSISIRPNFGRKGDLSALAMQVQVTPSSVKLGRYAGDQAQLHPVCDKPFWPDTDEADVGEFAPRIYLQVWIRAQNGDPGELKTRLLNQAWPFMDMLAANGLQDIYVSETPRNGRQTRDYRRLGLPTGVNPRNQGVDLEQVMIQINPSYHNGFGGMGADGEPNPTAGGNWLGALSRNVELYNADVPVAAAEGRDPEFQAPLTGVTGLQEIGDPSNPEQRRMPIYTDLAQVVVGGQTWDFRPQANPENQRDQLLKLIQGESQSAADTGSEPQVRMPGSAGPTSLDDALDAIGDFQ